MSDDECIHLMDPAFCSICNGRDAAAKRTPRAAPAPRPTTSTPRAPRTVAAKAPSKRLTRTVIATRSADTEESVQQYRSRWAGDREATFDAYVMVFFNTDARDFPGGFLSFARCASADPERKETAPALVARAERIMRDAGYESEDGGVVGGRRWRLAD